MLDIDIKVFVNYIKIQQYLKQLKKKEKRIMKRKKI